MDHYVFTPNPSEKDIDTTLKEITEHGHSLFPIAVHYTNHDENQKNMIHTHWHREMEILYIFKGIMEVKIEGQSYIAEEGDILFIPPNQLHEALAHNNSSCAFFAIVFDSSFIESHFSDLIQQSYIDPIIKFASKHTLHATNELPNIAKLRKYVIKIIDDFALKEPFFELSLKANLLIFFKNLYVNKERLIQVDQHVDSKNALISYKCKKVVLYLEENYKNRITLEEVSAHVGFSKEHFCRFFKKNFRVSFVTYLNQMRVKKAEYLLLNTDLKVIDIALESGFEDSNYFTTTFKKETKLTPSDYRKRPNNNIFL